MLELITSQIMVFAVARAVTGTYLMIAVLRELLFAPYSEIL